MGCVYILVNNGMPDLIKIGQTSVTAEDRAKQLSRETAAPFPFEAAFALYCEWYIELEKAIHRKLAYCRVSTNKEFFKCPVDDAIMELKQLHLGRLNIKIPWLESRKTKLEERCEEAEKAEQALLKRGCAARQETDFLESEVARLEAEVIKAHQQIEVLRSEAGKAEKELLERGYAARRKIESLESLESELEKLEAEITKAHQQIEVLRSESASQRIETESLKGEIKSLESRKTKLIERCEKAEQKERALLAKGDALHQKNTWLEIKIERLEAEEDRLRKERDQKKYKNAAGQIEVINANESRTVPA